MDITEFTSNWTERAKNNEFRSPFGRSNEISKVASIVSSGGGISSCLLLAEPGVGKTAIVEGVAIDIVTNKISQLKDFEVLALNMASLRSGTKFVGELEEKLELLFEYFESTPNSILFIDEIHMIMGAGATKDDEASTIGNYLKEKLARGVIRCIGATTNSEYNQYIKNDQALVRRFETILVPEFSATVTLSALRYLTEEWQKKYAIQISNGACKEAIRLSTELSQYIGEYFPGKAIKIIEQGLSHLSGKIESHTVGYEIERLLNEKREELKFLERENNSEDEIEIDQLKNEVQMLEKSLAEEMAMNPERTILSALMTTKKKLSFIEKHYATFSTKEQEEIQELYNTRLKEYADRINELNSQLDNIPLRKLTDQLTELNLKSFITDLNRSS